MAKMFTSESSEANFFSLGLMTVCGLTHLGSVVRESVSVEFSVNSTPRDFEISSSLLYTYMVHSTVALPTKLAVNHPFRY